MTFCGWTEQDAIDILTAARIMDRHDRLSGFLKLSFKLARADRIEALEKELKILKEPTQ